MMTKPQVIKDNDKPVLVVIKYKDYIELLEKIHDAETFRIANEPATEYLPFDKCIEKLK